MRGVKQPIVLVDAPKKTTVSYDGATVPITNVTAFTSTELRGFGTSYATQETSYYKYTGVKIKLKKDTRLGLKDSDNTGTVKIETKPAIGMLVVEGILTLGIGTAIDLITGAHWVTKDRFVDVPAVLEKKTPRNRRALEKRVLSDY